MDIRRQDSDEYVCPDITLTHSSRKNANTLTRNDSDVYVYPDVPKAQSSNLQTLAAHNKLQTGQVLRSEEGIYDDADAKVRKKRMTTEQQRTPESSSNWLSQRTWKMLLSLAICIILLLVIVLVCVLALPKSSNSGAEVSTMSTTTSVVLTPTLSVNPSSTTIGAELTTTIKGNIFINMIIVRTKTLLL